MRNKFDPYHIKPMPNEDELELVKDRSKRAIRRQNKKRFDKREDYN